MTYAIVEAGLIATIKLMAGGVYTSDNVAADDFNILANNKESSVIVQPGRVDREVVASPRRIRNAWQIVINLFVPLRTDRATTYANVISKYQALMDHIDKYPTLNSTAGVIHAFITSVDEAIIWTGSGGGFWMVPMHMVVEERVGVTIAEAI